MQKYTLTTPPKNIYSKTKFYTSTALGNIGGAIEFQMEGLTSEIIEKAINLLIDAAEDFACALRQILKISSTMEIILICLSRRIMMIFVNSLRSA